MTKTRNSGFLLDELSSINVPYAGDFTKGEIEIVTGADAVEAIVCERRQKVKLLGLPDDAAALGVVFEDEYIIIVRDPVKFPSGSTGTYLRIIERGAINGAAGVVMLPVQGELILLREVFRHATRSWELECPRGFRSPDANLIATVETEIAEEMGLEIEDTGITELGPIYPDTGLLTGAARAFLVSLKQGAVKARPEPQEAFRALRKLPPEQLLVEIQTGKIRDGFTLAALQLAQVRGLLSLPVKLNN